MPKQKQELLGHVKTASSIVMLIDFGFLDIWCDDEKPTFPKWIARSPEAVERTNNAVDLKIIGPDALKAGKLFDRNWHPEYVYDIPQDGIKEISDLFDKLVKRRKLNASLEILSERITHKKRVQLSLEFGNDIGEVSLYSVWGVVLGKLPIGKELNIYGERMTERKWENYWRWVVLDIQPNIKPKTTKIIGHIPVDEANILISDVDSLKKLSDPDTLDGLADLAFWGRDEQILTEKLGADQLNDNTFGWVDLPINDAINKGIQLQEMREKGDIKFAYDFRPHSYKHLIYNQIRSSKTESGVISLDGATACCFMTSWGDGAFPVVGEFDIDNNLIRVRIDLGNKKTVKNMEYVRSKFG